ncbi:MAG: hypothetical protein EOM20_02320 [Spartobacteria bacterium]|nr:hypothetical protein [Spartobacteria bacterium]
MKRIESSLSAHGFVVVDLGAGFAGASDVLKPFHPLITWIELDAANTSERVSADYKRHEFITQAIAESEGKRTFIRRVFPNASSLTMPRGALVKGYGLERHFSEDRRLELEAITLPQLMVQLGLSRIDWLKTDLEGLDGPVLYASKMYLNTALVVQSELRFQPFYEREPSIFEVGVFMQNMGFEMIQLHTESWKYRTQRSAIMRNGRAAFADAVFFLAPEVIRQRMPEQYQAAIIKQILIACHYGYSNYAEYLLEQNTAWMDEKLFSELHILIRPASPTLSALTRVVNGLARYRIMHPFIRQMRRMGALLYRAAACVPGHPHVADW